MWIRIASRYAIFHIPEVVARYRVHPDPDGSRELRHYLVDLKVLEKNAHLLPPIERAYVYFIWGYKSKMRPDLPTARRLLTKSLTLAPANWRAIYMLLRCYIGRYAIKTALEQILK